jgi:hypothetical protein
MSIELACATISMLSAQEREVRNTANPMMITRHFGGLAMIYQAMKT